MGHQTLWLRGWWECGVGGLAPGGDSWWEGSLLAGLAVVCCCLRLVMCWARARVARR